MIDILKTHPFFADKTIISCEILENQGYCNENYLVLTDGVKYIARNLLREDIDRNYEWKVLNLAFKAGITAEPLVFDKVHGFMLFEFLEGEHLHSLDENTLILLVDTIKKFHSIKADVKHTPLQIENKSKDVLKAFENIDKYPKEYVLCHNDLNPLNIFFTDEAKLIDFEYASVNDRYFDLACVCVEFELDDSMQKIFLELYFDGHYILEKLEAYKVAYNILCKEWFSTLSS